MIIKKTHFRRAVLFSAISILTLVLLLAVLTPSASAGAVVIPPPEEDCTIEGLSPAAYSEGDQPANNSSAITVTAYCGPGGCRTYKLKIPVIYEDGPAYTDPEALFFFDWKLVRDTCAAPAVWAADVCEPYGGGTFSADGNLTLDTDQAGATLYVAAASSGPWLPVEANGPPWVLTMSDLAAIADALGAGHYSQLWFKSGESGLPTSLASMVEGRNARLGDWCPPIEDDPPG